MDDLYCPRCGKTLRTGPVAGRERAHCACGFVAFHNPPPVGMAAIEHQGRLVLIRRAGPPLAGYWAPPAGYVEMGESVPEAVVREAREECGLDIALAEDGLLGVWSHAEVGVVLIAYRARAVGGELVAGDDASAVGLFAPGQAPQEPEPAGGTPTDRWFHRAIREVIAAWERPEGSPGPVGPGSPAARR
jgi:8-oxo-dGTP diphosphatase